MQTVVGMFDTREDAREAIRRLREAGFGDDRIGVAMSETTRTEMVASGEEDLAGEGAAAGAVSGAGVGALVGLALVGSTIILPGIGPLVIGGYLAAALTGAAIGAGTGGLLGALIGSGIPEDEAKEYATRLESGEILVTVRADDHEVAKARDILAWEGARTV